MSEGLLIPAVILIVSGAILAVIGCGGVFPACSLDICLAGWCVAGAGCYLLVVKVA